jgi:hypothetical protein
MFCRLILLAALVSVLSTTGRSQDSQSQSLGDLARQLRSQKGSAQPKTVITNDDLPSASAGTILGLQSPVDLANSTKPGTDSSPLASLTQWESVVKQIDSIDRATLLKLVLHGANPDFPGHGNWEERLFTAKQTYVSQGQELTQRARQLLAEAHALKSAQANADDPRVKELGESLKELVRESVRADAAFQAVILEGRDLAHQAPGALGPSRR